MAISYLSGNSNSRKLRLREGITTLGLNPTGGTNAGESAALAKLQKAIYEGKAVARVTAKVPFGVPQDVIKKLVGNRGLLYNAVVNGNIGLLELLEAMEDSKFTEFERQNLLSAFVEAVLKVAIAGAGVANDFSKEHNVPLGDLNGRLLQGIRKLEQERDTSQKEVKKA